MAKIPQYSSLFLIITIFLQYFNGIHTACGKEYCTLARKVQDLVKSTRTYQFPTSNNEYFERKNGSTFACGNAEYDFIVVGAGSAGGVVAYRLSEIESFKVLALEAGFETPELSDMLGVNIYLHRTKYNWGYNTTVQKNGCLGSVGQRCPYPRGKMLGGSSAINFGMYVRGHKDDFNYWESLGNPGWAYEDVLPYFKKPETATFRKDLDVDYHGFDGPQKIGVPNDTPHLTQALLDAHIALGKLQGDYNGAVQDRVSRLQFFLDRNIRSSTNHAFISHARNRSNLDISINSFVNKILFTNGTATGVIYEKDGIQCTVRARKEVILSAGAINSPQILMLSGIGPKAELKKHDIKLIKDLPVGQNMQDHQFFPAIFYRTNRTFYNYTLDTSVKLWTENKRPLTPSLGQQSISFWNFLGAANSQPEVEFFFFGPPKLTADIPRILGYKNEYIESFKLLKRHSDISVNVELLHPKSRGTVTLQSKNPKDFPLINPNYFTDAKGQDLEMIYKGVEVALQFNETDAFKNLEAELLVLPIPGCDSKFKVLSKKWWYCTIKELSSTLFHPVSTTRMGPDPKHFVVDHELKVHGIKNLRVVDAGIFPDHISGHPNAACVMIAEKISDAIKKQYIGIN